ncbi:response regulator transcription factor [Defluviitalea raffinosedens]|uniref:response regulator transcription factor n=1 Tax=Defluviitalea raffinosedens TaxID=1450156 RepID=UPI00195D1106|nr:response regulator [Defluviitalea raffinosedens]MBM7685876.1 two-component system response regulator YesN [Defluviitalea raffinosedens]
MFKVLIAEDEDLIRKGLAYTIDWAKMGCMVVGEASNGEEGIKKIEELSPDLVITDIKMPIMDGLQMLQNFKEREFEAIIITGYGEFEYAKKAIELDVFDYLLKPIDEDKLYEVVGEVTKRISEKEILRKLKNTVKDIENIKLIDTEIYCQKSSYKYKNTPVVIDYIVHNYANKISIEDIADQLEVSPSYLSKKFKDDTCHTFNDFLNSYRIQKAINLLTEGKYKVYEIAEMVGFSDYKYFSYVFKSYMCCSPMEFLKANVLVRGGDSESNTAYSAELN